MQESIYQEIRQEIGRSMPGPLYLQIANRLTDRIERGEMIAGQPLPPQRQLCKLLDVGEVTARRAIKHLVDHGLLLTKHGSGTVIASGLPKRLRAQSPLNSRRRPFRIGIVSIGNTDGYPFIQPLVASIERASQNNPLAPNGISLQMLFLPPRLLVEQSILDRVPLEDIDGLVMMSPINTILLALSQQHSLPSALLFNDLADGISHCIVVDYGPGMMDAVTNLCAQGRSRFALITPQSDRFSSGQMASTFHTAIRANGIPIDTAQVIPAGYHEQQGFASTQRLLSQKNRPDVIIYASPHQAKGGLRAIEKAALNPREDVSLVVTSMDGQASVLDMPLMLIDLGLNRMVEAILTVLLHTSTTPSTPPQRQSITSRFIR
jgi:DNA-binding LacI/PurR family transcriptional regulator/DNA-binding transcriptional regulator YhcF (GntR family)